MKAVAAFKKVVLLVLGTAMQTYGEKLTDEQEVLSAVADLLGRLIDNKEGEAIGLAFSGLDARHQPSDGYEFKFYRGPDSKGWYTEDYGGEDYTVHLDVRPIQINGPLYEHRIAAEDSRRDAEDSAEQN